MIFGESLRGDIVERKSHGRFIAPYLYREEDAALLRGRADDLEIRYDRYDWRLNRS